MLTCPSQPANANESKGDTLGATRGNTTNGDTIEDTDGDTTGDTGDGDQVFAAIFTFFLCMMYPIFWFLVVKVFGEDICRKQHQCNEDSENQMIWDNTDYNGYEAI